MNVYLLKETSFAADTTSNFKTTTTTGFWSTAFEVGPSEEMRRMRRGRVSGYERLLLDTSRASQFMRDIVVSFKAKVSVLLSFGENERLNLELLATVSAQDVQIGPLSFGWLRRLWLYSELKMEAIH